MFDHTAIYNSVTSFTSQILEEEQRPNM